MSVDLREIAAAGRLYSAMTAVTGVAPGTAIGTTAAAALYNPRSSGKKLIVHRANMGYVSGTLGIGRVDWVSHASSIQAAFTGTAMVVQPGKFGLGAGVGLPLTTVTVPAGGVAFRPAFNLPPMLATTVLTPWNLVDEVDGAIELQPGMGVSLQGTAAAGTSPLVVFGFVWEEDTAD